MHPLDPDDARPPYVQLADALRRTIDDGAWPPGAKLPTHQQLADQYGVSLGTVKRALGDLQGASLIVSRQGQGAFVRTRRPLLESVPNIFAADTLSGAWVTCYQFRSKDGVHRHADISHITPESDRRVTARNHPPEPRTQRHSMAFRNLIEAQLANRHVIGHWKNTSDTRYFGSLHLAVLPGETVMDGYYTGLSSDVRVEAFRWTWVRLDPASLVGIDLSKRVLQEPDAIHALLEASPGAPLALSAVVEGE